MKTGRRSRVAGRRFLLASLLLLAPSLVAQSVAMMNRGIVVAHDRVIDLYDSQTLQRIWRTHGLEFAVAREMKIEPFAVDLAADEHYAYLAYPHKSRIDIVDLDKMERLGEQKAGSMPMDIQFLSNPTFLNARTLAVADPPGHRVLLL